MSETKMTQEKKDKIKKMVYASTRYENPQEEGDFPNPAVIDKLIDIETENFNSRLKELKDRKTKIEADKNMLMNLSKEEIAELTPRVQLWLVHAIPKYKEVVDEIQQEMEVQ